MPPRISPHRLPKPTTCQCFRTRPAPPVAEQGTRQLHSSSNHAVRNRPTGSIPRQKMFAWLNGPGKVFKDPLPNSTNYLSAYDREGNLLRVKRQQQQQKELDDADFDASEEELQARDRENGIEEEDVIQRSQDREKRRQEREDLEARDGIPRERQSDLRPYPLNQNFVSQSVLSEELREQIYQLVINGGYDIVSVSGGFGVDVRRVAAVVRLKTIEKQWEAEGKALATPYSKAVLSMLPQTPYRPRLSEPPPHESINDVPVHPSTRRQLFISTSESRDFTRADAAKAFDPKLLPADDRIVHTGLVRMHRWMLEGIPREKRREMQAELDDARDLENEAKARKQKQWEERTQVTVPGRRWDFKFQDFSAEKVGKDGRKRGAVGLRYGMPHEDRKRGQYKLPQKVE